MRTLVLPKESSETCQPIWNCALNQMVRHAVIDDTQALPLQPPIRILRASSYMLVVIEVNI
jgi:hypothetical protein